jgi:short-subunit dehydrogenase
MIHFIVLTDPANVASGSLLEGSALTVRHGSRVVLITGASSGIGLEAGRLFASRGESLVLVARRADRLERLERELVAGGAREAMVQMADLADPAQVDALIPRTMDRFGRIDVLVNNAGFGAQQLFERLSSQEMQRMVEVNLLSPMRLSRDAVRVMRVQGTGSIVNVASVGGVMPHPLNVVYCATKHGLVGFSRSLRLELMGSGIRVATICPGATRTEFFDVAARDIPFSRFISRFAESPTTVARAIVKASIEDVDLLFPTWSAWFLHVAQRWAPWLAERGNIRYRDEVTAAARSHSTSDHEAVTQSSGPTGPEPPSDFRPK